MDIGKQLEELIKISGMQKKKIAQELGITPATLSNYLHNKRTPPADLVIIMAKYFHVTTDYLYGLAPMKVKEPERYTVEEKKVIDAYHTMPTNVKDFIKTFTSDHDKTK